MQQTKLLTKQKINKVKIENRKRETTTKSAAKIKVVAVQLTRLTS